MKREEEQRRRQEQEMERKQRLADQKADANIFGNPAQTGGGGGGGGTGAGRQKMTVQQYNQYEAKMIQAYRAARLPREFSVEWSGPRRYFVNHRIKQSLWTDPRPLPQGWRSNPPSQDGTVRFTHHDGRVTLQDPRQPPLPPPQRPGWYIEPKDRRSLLIQQQQPGTQQRPASAGTQQRPASTNAAARGVSCPVCTLKNLPGAVKCKVCSHVLPTAQVSKCPVCTFNNPHGTTICKMCGKPLR